MKILLLVFILTISCAVKMKNKLPSDVNTNEGVSIKKLEFQKPDNWADSYYQKTIFQVEGPNISEDFSELSLICKGADFDFISDYQAKKPAIIKYKKTPITFITSSGFSKKTFISKGACRELALFKAPKNKGKNIRSSIKSISLIYVYNKGTYLKDLVFNTQFSGVKFLVE